MDIILNTDYEDYCVDHHIEKEFIDDMIIAIVVYVYHFENDLGVIIRKLLFTELPSIYSMSFISLKKKTRYIL